MREGAVGVESLERGFRVVYLPRPRLIGRTTIRYQQHSFPPTQPSEFPSCKLIITLPHLWLATSSKYHDFPSPHYVPCIYPTSPPLSPPHSPIPFLSPHHATYFPPFPATASQRPNAGWRARGVEKLNTKVSKEIRTS